MNKSLFYKKIVCIHCGGNFKLKRERGVRKYVCSNYDNHGKCIRIPIKEETLLSALKNRYREVDDEKRLADNVEKITVEDEMFFEIHFKNSDDPIIFSRNFIQY